MAQTDVHMQEPTRLMRIQVLRLPPEPDHTLSAILIDGRLVCFGLEDEPRATIRATKVQ